MKQRLFLLPTTRLKTTTKKRIHTYNCNAVHDAVRQRVGGGDRNESFSSVDSALFIKMLMKGGKRILLIEREINPRHPRRRKERMRQQHLVSRLCYCRASRLSHLFVSRPSLSRAPTRFVVLSPSSVKLCRIYFQKCCCRAGRSVGNKRSSFLVFVAPDASACRCLF